MQEFQQLFEYFIQNEGPWAILFVFLLVFSIRASATREAKMREDITEKLNDIQKDTTLMLETWKLIIERELERREKQ